MFNRLMHFFGIQEDEDERGAHTTADEEVLAQDVKKTRNNIVSLHAHKSSKLVLCEPRSYEEAQQLADYLRSRRVIVVNLQRIHPDHAIRIVDFLSGTVYALNGAISKVGTNIFVCAPESTEIQGTISEWLHEQAAPM